MMGIDEHRMGRLLVRCPMCRSVVVESVGFCSVRWAGGGGALLMCVRRRLRYFGVLDGDRERGKGLRLLVLCWVTAWVVLSEKETERVWWQDTYIWFVNGCDGHCLFL